MTYYLLFMFWNFDNSLTYSIIPQKSKAACVDLVAHMSNEKEDGYIKREAKCLNKDEIRKELENK